MLSAAHTHEPQCPQVAPACQVVWDIILKLIVLHIFKVGQNHIYTVHIRYFWQGNHQIYGHIRCIYTVLANPTHFARSWLLYVMNTFIGKEAVWFLTLYSILVSSQMVQSWRASRYWPTCFTWAIFWRWASTSGVIIENNVFSKTRWWLVPGGGNGPPASGKAGGMTWAIKEWN